MGPQRGARDGKAKADTAGIAAARSVEPDEGFAYRCKLVFGQFDAKCPLR